MGNLTRISGSFVIPKSFHGKDLNITGSTEFSASNFSITASEGVHITGSMNVSGGVLTVENLHLSGGSITPATSSELYVKYAQTGSFASGSDLVQILAESSSYVLEAETGSFASGSDIQIIKAESASYVMSTNTGSYASGSDLHQILAQSSSYVLEAETGSFASGSDLAAIKAESASYISNFQSESFVTLKATGDISTSGSIYAREFHTEFTSASVVYASGSNKFGDTLDDRHEFTGSIEATGSLLTIDNVGGVSGSITSTGSFGVLRAGDIELENERGHWRIIEESEYLSIYNVKSNKKYKFVLEEIE
jgi:hypothetical protein